ncbi:glycosyltransferase family 4 protein [Planktosalinus lacus]|uniref:Glycoside hydrolase n=1 Tax=Planktosalinus lacus TaxID=1526573 RepID=A0A8J2V868_9FLAO|nr:glycosyltransferase family 4 protein [Planktosalinus lacus]GGD84732.1 glycoside hydrolase [Planktosalinus lacus]
MHICFITSEYPKPGYPHGGVGTFVKIIANKLVEFGHRVSIVGINYENKSEEELNDDLKIYRLKPKNYKGITWFLNSKSISDKIRQIHNNEAIDIVESAELGLAFIKKQKNIKYIIRLHGGHHFFAEAEKRKINRWKGLQEKRSFKKADAFIAVSKYVKIHTSKYLSYHGKPVRIIKNPLSIEKFKPDSNIPVNPNKIVFAGTVCEKKGVRQLILALPYIKKVNPEAEIHIYGRDWFFKDNTSYINFLKKNTLPQIGEHMKSVFFHGPVSYDKISEIYAGAKLCVFPSHMETQGLVAPEAMAMEKVVVFSLTGPGPETIVHQKTGLLCNPYSPEDIADKVNWALSNPNKAESIGKNARAFVVKTFDQEKIIKENIDFFNELIN